MLLRQVIVPTSLNTHRRRVITRVHKSEDAWDIDKERDAVRYKRESLESAFRIGQKEAMDKMKERIEEWELYTDKEESVNSSKDD